jgi:CRISPR-associated endonuclease/helicase Cas3
MIYARPKDGAQDKSAWQTLEDHLTGVAEIAESFASKFGSGAIAKAAGYLHDLGKAAPEFQEYLEQAALQDADKSISCSIHHSEAGAAWAVERFGNAGFGPFLGTTLAYLIAGHHAGLPDYNTDGQASLNYRLARGKGNLAAIRDAVSAFSALLESSASALEKAAKPIPSCMRSTEDYHLWVRFLFSTLVDADRIDAEKFDRPTPAIQQTFCSLKELKERFDRYMDEHFRYTEGADLEDEAAKLSKLRNDVLLDCRRAGQFETSSSRFTLTVPTGGGKTLASMAFALERAVAQDLERIIYVIPYTSIIEQTADVFRKIFGTENIVEHHSNIDYKESDDSLSQKMNRAAENWDAPIILTTNVQFFESLYSAKASRCRKIHRIANSVVILDEAQLLKPELLSPCVDVLNRLSESYRTTILLSTATQPAEALSELDRICRTRTPPKKLLETKAIISDPSRLYSNLARVRYNFDDSKEPHSWEEIADQLEEHDEVLCVVNTRRDCRDLYDILKEREKARLIDYGEEGQCSETIHLSALMCGEHRSKVIKTLRERLEENRTISTKKPLRVISTQLIEAGVDLDFPVVFRALAGLDSIVQAAGRCNREGRLGAKGGLVRVFAPLKQAPQGLLRKGEDAMRALLRRAMLDMDRLETYDDYFKHFYSSLNNLDEKNVIKRLSCNISNNSFEAPFRTVGEEFKIIEDDCSCPVVVQYGEGAELIEQFRQGNFRLRHFRRLQRFSVNIPRHELEKLTKEGKVEEILPDLFVQAVPNLYDDDFGFDLFREGFVGLDFYV